MGYLVNLFAARVADGEFCVVDRALPSINWWTHCFLWEFMQAEYYLNDLHIKQKKGISAFSFKK